MKASKLFALILVVLFCITSCNKDAEPLSPIINFDKESESFFQDGINFTSESENRLFSFTTNTNWKITLQESTNNDNWCFINYSIGKEGHHTVSVNVKQNNSFEDRSIVLTLHAGDLARTTTITQQKKRTITMPTNKYNISKDGGAIDIKINTNIEYSIEIPATCKDWIKQISTKGLQTSILTFGIEKNLSPIIRKGVLTIKGDNISENIEITQDAETAILNIEEPGTLSTLLKDEISQINRIKLTGYINGNDVIILRRMNNLIYLDLKECTIVEGGNSYAAGEWATEPLFYYTSNNKIGPRMFADLSNIKEIILPSNTTEIGDYAFIRNNSIEKISMPNSVMTIGVDAFMFCSSLKNINISNSISTISKNLFYGCLSLHEITIPNSVIEIGEYAFSECQSLERVHLPNSLKGIYNGALQKTAIKEIAMPENISIIGLYVFAECKNLETVNIPKSTKTIGNECFINSKNISKVFLHAVPSNLTHIGSRLFNNEVYEKATLYIPSGSRALYTYTEFGNFKNIIELE